MEKLELSVVSTLPSVDGVLIGFDRSDYKLMVRSTVVTPVAGSEERIKQLREETKEKYSGNLGKKYAIVFYEISDKSLVITDFFRACLIDPEFYVKNLFNNGVLAAVVDEFTLNENWNSEAERETDFGLYCRLLEVVNVFWRDVCNILPQATQSYFNLMMKLRNVYYGK